MQPDSTERGPVAPAPAGTRPAPRLRDLSPTQWRSGIAAWLGWTFDGLDMHLYTLVAAPFVAQLLQVADPANPLVKEKSSWIQAAFLVGWALGGGFFGRVGDLLGRSRALALTILTYALFTGMSFVAQTWWQLLIFRFLAALGVGGEWAVGSSLLAETWPRRWRPWIAAVLQSGVNLGVLLACLSVFLLATVSEAMHWEYQPRWVFLVGVLPALAVFWIRRAVPETEEWVAAKRAAREQTPGVAELFRGPVRRTTLLTILVCATSLSGWWGFMFWNQQHLRNLPELASWTPQARDRLVSVAFFLIIAVSIVGNFFAGWLAKRLGYRRAILIMFAGLCGSMVWTFGVPRGHTALLWSAPWVGFFSGVFGLFTMYLPPLFPTLLRTTGAGFCYNIGRIGAALGTVFSGALTPGGDFRRTLLGIGLLYVPAMVVAWLMPDTRDTDAD